MDSKFKLTFRNDIQGLRAVAIALVVLAHANVPGFSGGFVGVDVFFVLSGYLITGLLVKERLSTGRVRYGQFLVRRLRRLLPAMILMLVAVLVAATLLLSAYETRMQTGSFVYSATWTSNFFFAFADFDYFSVLKTKDLFLHTWSLGIEEQYYVVWPWLMVAAFAMAGGKKHAGRDRKILLAVLAAIFVSSLTLCLYWAQTSPVMGFYMMPARGWQFALGAAIFVGFHNFGQSTGTHQDDASSSQFYAIAGGTGLVLIIASAILLHSELTYPGYYALFPSLGAAAIILSGQRGKLIGVNRALSTKLFVWVGDRSYSLYLWHWPVFLLGDAYGLTNHAVGTLSLIMVSLILSTLSYRYVERPFWKGRFRVATSRRTVLASMIAMVAVVGLSQALRTNVYGEPIFADNLNGYDPRVDAPAIYTAGFDCDTGHFSAELMPCEAGARDAKFTAVLLGDSVGAQWASMLPEIYAAPEWQVVVLTKSACAMVDEDYYYEKARGTYDVCTTWRNAALDYLADLQPDIVFVGSSSDYKFSELQWLGGTERVLARLTAAAGQVVVIPGTPALSFDGPSCLDEPYRFSFRLTNSKRECEEVMADTRVVEVAEYLRTSVSKYDDARLLNLNDLVCPRQRCAARRTDGLTVYRDEKHLTDTFVISQVPVVRRRLDELNLRPFIRDKRAGLTMAE